VAWLLVEIEVGHLLPEPDIYVFHQMSKHIAHPTELLVVLYLSSLLIQLCFISIINATAISLLNQQQMMGTSKLLAN
jgi:hypothetical protein